jgi:hypothetical protein
MAFRNKAATRACVTAAGIVLAAGLLPAQGGAWEVRHRHLHKGAMGTLRISDAGVAFEEHGKGSKCSRTWSYDDIQQLELSPDRLTIVTYEDQRKQFGRDRVFVFDELPAELAGAIYPMFSSKLDQRFVAAIADERVTPEWQIPAKLVHGRSGSQGVLEMADDRIVFKTSEQEDSRTWRITDIENVSSSGTFDLTINTHERDYRFQLKQPLPEDSYRRLWRRINLADGLEILSSASGETK